MFQRFSLIIAGMLAATIPAAAQRPGLRGGGPEDLLRLRERLALTEQQLTQLRALRDQRLAEQRARMTEMMELRSKLRSGDLSQEEARRTMRERMEAVRQQQTAAMERMRQVLTEEQRNRLSEVRRQAVREQMRARVLRERLDDRRFRTELRMRGMRERAYMRDRMLDRARERMRLRGQDFRPRRPPDI